MMKRAGYGIVVAVIAVLAGITGCRPKVSKMAQGVTPVVANFYVLNVEIDRVRQKIRDAAPSKADTLQATYQQLLAQARALSNDALADPELKKRGALQNAMTACLTDEQAFVDIEIQAVGDYAAESKLGDQINGINQHSRGNSIKMREVEGQVSALFAEQQRYHQQLLKLLPSVAAAAGSCRTSMQAYNSVLASEKIVNFFNDEGMFNLLAWENTRPEHKTTAVKPKHHAAAKPRKMKHK